MEDNLENTESTELSDEQMDQLVNESEKTPDTTERPMSDEPAKTENAGDFYLEFNHGGKQIRATREQALKYAQMGYDYPQKMAVRKAVRKEA